MSAELSGRGGPDVSMEREFANWRLALEKQFAGGGQLDAGGQDAARELGVRPCEGLAALSDRAVPADALESERQKWFAVLQGAGGRRLADPFVLRHRSRREAVRRSLRPAGGIRHPVGCAERRIRAAGGEMDRGGRGRFLRYAPCAAGSPQDGRRRSSHARCDRRAPDRLDGSAAGRTRGACGPRHREIPGALRNRVRRAGAGGAGGGVCRGRAPVRAHKPDAPAEPLHRRRADQAPVALARRQAVDEGEGRRRTGGRRPGRADAGDAGAPRRARRARLREGPSLAVRFRAGLSAIRRPTTSCGPSPT